MSRDSFCVVVPAYREAGRIGDVARRILTFCDLLVVVDDGSLDETAIEAQVAGAHVIRHSENRGKGAALETGFAYARGADLEFVITMDADGQHDPAHIPELVEAYRRQAGAGKKPAKDEFLSKRPDTRTYGQPAGAKRTDFGNRGKCLCFRT